MERSEPTLVPEWLRSTGSVTGGGNSAHHFASSSSHSGIFRFLSFMDPMFSFVFYTYTAISTHIHIVEASIWMNLMGTSFD